VWCSDDFLQATDDVHIVNRVLLVLLVLAAAGAALWHVFGKPQRQADGTATTPQPAPEFDFEASDVVLRQMGPDGRLQYELAAQRFAQSTDGGGVLAEQLTLYHDPPGTVPGGAHRWTLTAATARLPAGAEVISLQGEVRASGVPLGRRAPVQVSAEQLEYRIASQEVSTTTDVLLEWGASRFRGRGLSVNVNTGAWALESGDGTLVP
jgi:LPS export ABC transporter protein LptC